MSLFVYALADDRIIVVTDTLAVDPDGQALLFTSKCSIVLHLDMVIVATGVGQIADDWRTFLNTEVVARSMDDVDKVAPGQLRRIFASYGDRLTGLTTTVYHFGYSPEAEHYVGFAYRSTADFVSQPLPQDSFGIKPEPTGQLKGPQDIDGWISLAEQVQADQDQLRAAGNVRTSVPVHIGGELVLVSLAGGGISAAKIHQFPGYADHWNTMASRAGRPNPQAGGNVTPTPEAEL